MYTTNTALSKTNLGIKLLNAKSGSHMRREGNLKCERE